MTISAQYGSALTTSTNGNPNSLGTVNPFPTPFVNPFTVSPAWVSQATKAFFPTFNAVSQGGTKNVTMHFIPSAGAAVTFTIAFWQYDQISNTWSIPKNGGTNAYTGDTYDVLNAPGIDPWYPQLVSISSGTLAINFDSSAIQAE